MLAQVSRLLKAGLARPTSLTGAIVDRRQRVFRGASGGIASPEDLKDPP
jgi:hypothetical protein